MANKAPYILVPDTDDLYPGTLDFTFSFKFKLVMDAGIVSSLLPGNYGPFVGFHKNLYYINKAEDGLRLFVNTGYMPAAINRYYRNGDYLLAAQTGTHNPFTFQITPNTTYTVSFSKLWNEFSSLTHQLELMVNGSPNYQSLTGRHRAMMRSTSGYAIFAGVYETYHRFPSDLGSISLQVDDIALTMKEEQVTNLKYRMRIDSYLDTKSYADPVTITPTTAAPAPSPTPAPVITAPAPAPAPVPSPIPPGATLFLMHTGGVRWSQDNGSTWNQLTTVPATTSQWDTIVKTPTGRWILGGGNGLTQPNHATSEDLNYWYQSPDPITVGSNGSTRTRYIMSTAGPGLVLMPGSGSSGMLLSTDNGYSWGRITTPSYNDAFYDPTSGLFILSRASNISTTTDGVTFTTRSSTSGSWYKIAKGNAAIVINNLAGSSYLRSINGTSWSTIVGGAAIGSALAGNPAGIFVSGATTTLNVSVDDGLTWANATGLPYAFNVVRSIQWTGTEFVVMTFTNTGQETKLMASSDGITWTQRGSTLPALTSGSYNYLDVATV